MRSYDTDNGKSSHVEALSLKSDASALAVYAREVWNGDFSRGYRKGYLFIVRPEDGGHITTTALKLEHENDDEFRWLTSSSAMFFTDYGKVIIGWHLWRASSGDSDGYRLEDNTMYGSKLRIG